MGELKPTEPIPEYAEGALYYRALPETDSEVIVYGMSYGKGRVCISDRGDPINIRDAWCYPSIRSAIRAAAQWDGQGDPPDGWHRHPRTGRRRKDGDPSTEEVRW